MKPPVKLFALGCLAILLLTVLPSLCLAATVPKVYTLENGLKVVLLEDHSSPLVAEAVWVHVGGKDESEQLAGFSFYLEHLIPMGTQKKGPRQQQMEIFRTGGISSIQADYDRTFFFAEVDKTEQEMALEALCQQVTQASLFDAAVEQLRPFLTRELKEAYDEPNQVLFFEQMRIAFPNQPYRFPYLGNFSTLASLEHTTADSFYGSFYVPNNMVVALGGDINPAKALEKVKSLFGRLRASKALPGKPKFEPAFTGPRLVVKNLPRMEASASVLFPTPGFRHPDRFALAVLARLLEEAATEPPASKSPELKNAPLPLSARFQLLEERGLLALTAYPATIAQSVETAERLLAAAQRARSRGFTEAEVTRVARQMRLEAAIRRNPVGVRVQDLAQATLFGDVRYGWDLEANLGRVSATDVNRVAATYLAGKNGKVLIILPKGERIPSQAEQDRLTKAIAGLDAGIAAPPAPDFAPTLYAPEKGVPLPHPEAKAAVAASRSVLPNGMVLLVKQESGQGLVAASLQIRAGSAFDPEGKEGLSQMVASALTLETKSIPGTEFQRRAAAIGSTFGITASSETVEAGLTVFPGDLPEALALLAAPVLGPTFPESQMTAVRERMLRFREAQSASPEQAAQVLAREKVYRGHPYGRPAAGTESTLGAISRADMVSFHRRFYRPDRAVLTLAGEVSPEDAQRLAASAFGAWAPPEGETAPPELPEGATKDALTGDFSRLVNRLPAAVVIGFPGVALRDPEFPLIRALGGLLAARGTLDLVLSEPMALSVTAIPEGLLRGGALYVEATAAPSEISRVAFELQLRARAFGVKEVTPATVADLIAIERGRVLREKEGIYTLASNLGYYELLGAGFATYDEEKTLPANLTPALLKDAAARYLDATKMVRVSAGPPTR